MNVLDADFPVLIYSQQIIMKLTTPFVDVPIKEDGLIINMIHQKQLVTV